MSLWIVVLILAHQALREQDKRSSAGTGSVVTHPYNGDGSQCSSNLDLTLSLMNSPLHVLIVEEDDEVRDIYKTLFETQGFVASTAKRGLDAIELSKCGPDAVFSSLVFRDISGFDLCRALRAQPQTAESLIVALTGYSENGLQETITKAGFDAYLLKPVRLQAILDLLKRLQTRSGTSTGLKVA